MSDATREAAGTVPHVDPDPAVVEDLKRKADAVLHPSA